MMRVARAVALSALAWSLVALANTARAAAPAPAAERPSALELTWTSPAGCPVTNDVITRIDALLAPRTTRDFEVPLRARAVITQTNPDAFELALDTQQSDQHFARTLRASTCVELADAAALVLALALDPDLAARRGEGVAPDAEPDPDPGSESNPASDPDPDPGSDPGADSEPGPNPSAAPVPAPRNPPRVIILTHRKAAPSWHLAVTAALDLGTTSSVALGPSASLSFSSRAFELALDALWLPPRRSNIPADPTKGGDLQLFALAPRVCFVPLQRRFAAGVCGTFEAGQLSGRGFGTANDSSRATWWAAAGPALFGRYFALPFFGITTRVELLAPLQDIEFTLENVGVAHRVPSVVGRFALGVEAHFN